MRIKKTVVLAALAAATVTMGVGSTAGAETQAPKQGDEHVVMLEPTTGMGTQASGGGGRSHDFTGDGIPDILARSTGGNLRVYPNSGTFNGTATYPSVVTINSGWGAFTWVGSADVNGDGWSDVLATDNWGGNLYVAVHSGQFNGTSTLTPGLVNIGSGWNINDMVYVYDYNGDGFDDLLARRAGTGDSYVYFNNGGINGLATFQSPIQFMSGGLADEYQNVADVTLDGSPDFIFVQDGHMALIELNSGGFAELGYGWGTVSTILFTDVDGDGREDILGKRKSDNTLRAYQHSGTFAPVNGTAYDTYRAPVLVGTNWHVNNIIA